MPDENKMNIAINQRVWWTAKDGSRTLHGTVVSDPYECRVNVKCDDGFVAIVYVDRLSTDGVTW